MPASTRQHARSPHFLGLRASDTGHIIKTRKTVSRHAQTEHETVLQKND